MAILPVSSVEHRRRHCQTKGTQTACYPSSRQTKSHRITVDAIAFSFIALDVTRFVTSKLSIAFPTDDDVVGALHLISDAVQCVGVQCRR